MTFAREFGPLARLLRVLFDEDGSAGQLDVAQAGIAEAPDAAAAAEELLEGAEDDARRGDFFVRRHLSAWSLVFGQGLSLRASACRYVRRSPPSGPAPAAVAAVAVLADEAVDHLEQLPGAEGLGDVGVEAGV